MRTIQEIKDAIEGLDEMKIIQAQSDPAASIEYATLWGARKALMWILGQGCEKINNAMDLAISLGVEIRNEQAEQN